MAKMKNYNCPKCGESLQAWADLDACAKFNINENGRLKRTEIKNCFQSDYRCGVACSKCDFDISVDDMDESQSHLIKAAQSAFSKQESIDFLTSKKTN